MRRTAAHCGSLQDRVLREDKRLDFKLSVSERTPRAVLASPPCVWGPQFLSKA